MSQPRLPPEDEDEIASLEGLRETWKIPPEDEIASLEELRETWKKAGRTSDMDEQVLALMEKFDKNKTGTFQITEVAGICREVVRVTTENHKKTTANRTLRHIIAGLALAVVTLSLMNFAMGYVAVALQKEAWVAGKGGSPTMTDAEGRAIATSSSDMLVQDGVMMDKRSCASSGGDDGACQPLATREVPLKPSKLFSGMPDSLFENLKRFNLTSPQGDQMVLQIVGWSRKLQSGSKCGSIVRVRTERGSFILDDYDIILSADLKDDLSKEGFSWAEDPSLSLSGYGRRLSEAHVALGMFSLFQNYEWKCESTQRPLENLAPPYQFTLEKRVPCPGNCDSIHFPDLKLPGYVEDMRRPFIATRTRVYAFEKHVVTIDEVPNRPFVQQMSLINLETFQVRKQVMSLDNVHSCSVESGSQEEADFYRMKGFDIAVLGVATEMNRTVRRYALHPQNSTGGVKPQFVVEYWEDATTDYPLKYFMPHVRETSIAYFRDFSKVLSVDEDMFLELFQSCNKTDSSGLELNLDLVHDESEDVLRIYRGLLFNSALLTGIENHAYWSSVAGMLFSDDLADYYDSVSNTSESRNSSNRRLPTYSQETEECNTFPPPDGFVIKGAGRSAKIEFCSKLSSDTGPPGGSTISLEATASGTLKPFFDPLMSLTLSGTAGIEARWEKKLLKSVTPSGKLKLELKYEATVWEGNVGCSLAGSIEGALKTPISTPSGKVHYDVILSGAIPAECKLGKAVSAKLTSKLTYSHKNRWLPLKKGDTAKNPDETLSLVLQMETEVKVGGMFAIKQMNELMLMENTNVNKATISSGPLPLPSLAWTKACTYVGMDCSGLELDIPVRRGQPPIKCASATQVWDNLRGVYSPWWYSYVGVDVHAPGCKRNTQKCVCRLATWQGPTFPGPTVGPCISYYHPPAGGPPVSPEDQFKWRELLDSSCQRVRSWLRWDAIHELHDQWYTFGQSSTLFEKTVAAAAKGEATLRQLRCGEGQVAPLCVP